MEILGDSLGMMPQYNGQRGKSDKWLLPSFTYLQWTEAALTSSRGKFYDQPVFEDTESCRLNGLCELARLAHGTGASVSISRLALPARSYSGMLRA